MAATNAPKTPAALPATSVDADLVDDNGQPIAAGAAADEDLVDDSGQPVGPNAPQSFGIGSGGGLFDGLELAPPPSLPEYDGKFGNLTAGVRKGALGTVFGLGKIVRGAATGDFGEFERPGARDEFAQAMSGGKLESLDPRGGAQQIGHLTEQVAESFLPAGAVARGIRSASAYGRAAKLAATIFGEGASGAGTAFAQTGGEVDTSLVAGGISGAVAGTLGLKGALTSAKKIMDPDLLPLAQEFKIPLTVAEKTQDLLKQVKESFLKSSTMAGRQFLEFGIERNKLLRTAAEGLIDVSRALDPKTAGAFIQEGITKFEKAARSEYGAITDDLLERNGDLLLETDGALKETAKKLFDDLSTDYAPSVGKIDDVGKAKAILMDFIETTEKPAAAAGHHGKPAVNVDDMLADALGYDVAKEAPKEKQLTFREAKRLRTLLYKIADSEEISIGQGALKQMNKALDEEIMNALPEADGQMFRAASAAYRKSMETIETTVIRSMKKNGTSETILDSLLAKGAETRASTLRQVLDAGDMDKVRSAFWLRVMDQVDDGDVFMGDKLRKMMDNLSPGAKEALFEDKALVDKIERFTTLADTLAIPKDSMQKLKEGKFMQMAGQFAPRAIAGAGVTTGVNMLLNRGTSGEWAFWGTTGAIVAISPVVMARMMLKKEVVNDLTRALTTQPGTTAAKQLATRIAAYVARETSAMGGDGSTAHISLELTPGAGSGGGDGGAPEMSNEEWMAAHPELYPPEWLAAYLKLHPPELAPPPKP